MGKRPSQSDQAWAEARKRHQLSNAQVEMARRLGLNPRKLGKIDNHRQEPWKLPLRRFIEELYAERFGSPLPAVGHKRGGRQRRPGAADEDIERVPVLRVPGGRPPTDGR